MSTVSLTILLSYSPTTMYTMSECGSVYMGSGAVDVCVIALKSE